MPNYTHECAQCEEQADFFYSLKDPEFTDNTTQECPKCGGVAERVVPGKVNFSIRGWSPGKELKVDKEVEKQNEIMAEPLTPGEINELPDIAAEEEKRRGLKPGTILGHKGEPNITDEKKKVAHEKAVEQSRIADKYRTSDSKKNAG